MVWNLELVADEAVEPLPWLENQPFCIIHRNPLESFQLVYKVLQNGQKHYIETTSSLKLYMS